ncbi:MAG: NADH-quinone oxidoreductase subunit I [Deltaproteobacteria bacterium]|nr:NADH-quinone oxidoreductase subunit I [Deltaproteobacteria bacterium]
MAARVVLIRRTQPSFLERIYVPEVARGLATTFGQLVRNLVHTWTSKLPRVRSTLNAVRKALAPVPGLGAIVRGLLPGERDGIVTVDYPNEQIWQPPYYRAAHRLMQHEDGRTRCTACMLCATNCPAHCIHIEAQEVEDPAVEKAPRRYDIDILRCVFCGFCVEACPCDAIRMDSGIVDDVQYGRTVLDINFLMKRGAKVTHPSDHRHDRREFFNGLPGH